MTEEMKMPGGWHLDKRVSIGHLITTGTVVAALFAWANSLDGRVQRNDMRIETNADSIQRIEERQDAQNMEIIRQLDRMNDKLDKHVELHIPSQ